MKKDRPINEYINFFFRAKSNYAYFYYCLFFKELYILLLNTLKFNIFLNENGHNEFVKCRVALLPKDAGCKSVLSSNLLILDKRIN